jgi:hypothetical protein
MIRGRAERKAIVKEEEKSIFIPETLLSTKIPNCKNARLHGRNGEKQTWDRWGERKTTTRKAE